MNLLPNGNDAKQPTKYVLHPIDRVNRMIGFVLVLRLGFEDIAREYDKHFQRYTVLCDSIVEEIEIAVYQLRNS